MVTKNIQQMNTEDKAKGLVSKFKPFLYKGLTSPKSDAVILNAKNCALIAVDEILTSEAIAYPNQEIETGQVFKEYWEEVKEKIKQL